MSASRKRASQADWSREYRARNPWVTLWDGMRSRAGNRRGDRPTYNQIELRMTPQEFRDWLSQQDYFPGCTVDRIDSTGHYEIGNIQLLSRSDNSRKKGRNYLAPEGHLWCSGCQDYHPKEEFGKDCTTGTGFRSSCKKVSRAECLARYHRRKGNQ